MHVEKYRSLVAVYAMIVNDKNEILLLRRANTGYRDGYYDMPAGHLEDGETLREATIREVMEETGLSVSVDDVEFLQLMHRKSTGERVYLDATFRVNKWDGEPRIVELEKCDHMAWFPLDSLPEMIVPHQRYVLEDFAAGRTYREVGWRGNLDE